MPLIPAMFSVNGSSLFSPEVDDNDDGNTLKLAKAVHVLSPSEYDSVLSSCEWRDRCHCKSSEVGMREPTVAGTDTSTREDGDVSVEMPADSLILTAHCLG